MQAERRGADAPPDFPAAERQTLTLSVISSAAQAGGDEKKAAPAAFFHDDVYSPCLVSRCASFSRMRADLPERSRR